MAKMAIAFTILLIMGISMGGNTFVFPFPSLRGTTPPTPLGISISEVIITICPIKDNEHPIYEVDLSNTYADPNPFEVNEDGNLYVDGLMDEDEWIKDFCYLAYLEGKIIDRQCFPKDEPSSAGDEYSFKFTTPIPAYVPQGHWNIHLILRNDAKKELACIQATYTVAQIV